MKTFLSSLTLITLLAGSALAPIGVSQVRAVTYYPGYTCYYRDIAGRCIQYNTSGSDYTRYHTGYGRSLYGNRKTYPFASMFNTYGVTQSPWDNRYSNRYRNSYYFNRFEEDDDDNDYFDDDDDFGRYLYGENDDDDYRIYYDEDDDSYRPYRLQDDDDFYEDDWRDDDDFGSYEYEHTRVFCDGRDCSYGHNRY